MIVNIAILMNLTIISNLLQIFDILKYIFAYNTFFEYMLITRMPAVPILLKLACVFPSVKIVPKPGMAVWYFLFYYSSFLHTLRKACWTE
ncbi:MAG: hypothetical protein JWR05_269 [Mucilaginibacter sp.]|nr:hypothetical protein [Mucilaginibacter sp.]